MKRIKEQIDLDLKKQKRFEVIMLIVAIAMFVTAFGMFAQNFID